MDSESTLECCSADLTDTIVANLRSCYSFALSHGWLPFACVLANCALGAVSGTLTGARRRTTYFVSFRMPPNRQKISVAGDERKSRIIV